MNQIGVMYVKKSHMKAEIVSAGILHGIKPINENLYDVIHLLGVFLYNICSVNDCEIFYT